MNIIIDSNVLFSALIKDSVTRGLILEYNGVFLFPEFIFEEMERHKRQLFSKSGMNKKDFNRLLDIILEKVEIVPNQDLLPHKEKAVEIVKDIDPDDAVFIACALAYPGSILWSGDKALKRQNKIRVLSTKEIIRFL